MVDAAGIEISAPIREGDLLFFGEGRNGVLQRVETIERNRRRVQSAQPGEQVGVRVWNPVATGDGVEKAMDADRAILVGEVSHFYSNLSVVGIMLENSLSIGDRVEIRGPNNRFVQTVRSIEVNHQRRNRAGAGDSIGLAVILQATEGDRVYRSHLFFDADCREWPQWNNFPSSNRSAQVWPSLQRCVLAAGAARRNWRHLVRPW
jgi:GTPase